jgi:predicted O-methyltransferase YrrM
MRKFTALSEKLYDYLLAIGPKEPLLLARLRAETAKLAAAGMQISPDQGAFLRFLVGAIGAKRCLEIGVFTGYSALCTAMALAPGGKLIAMDINPQWTAIARRYWRQAGLADTIELKLGPALATLDDLIKQGRSGRFDFAFIDADKENYENYFDRVLALLRPGGVVAVDNVLWSGRVADPNARDADSKALRAFNRARAKDRRIELAVLALADGVTLARKKP